MNILKRFRRLVNVDEDVYKKSGPRDSHLLDILAITVPISAFIAGTAFAFLFHFLIGNTFLSISMAGLVAYMFWKHDASLIDTGNGKVIAFRLVLSLVIALIISIPFKVYYAHDDIVNAIVQENNEYNQDLEEQIYQAKLEIYNEEKRLQDMIIEGSRTYDNTGKVQVLADARRLNNAFQNNKGDRLREVEEMYSSKSREPNLSKLSLATRYAINMFNPESPMDLLMTLLILCAIVILEASPVLTWMGLREGDYMLQKENTKEVVKMVNNRVFDINHSIVRAQNLGDLKKLFTEKDVWETIRSQAHTNFQRPEEILQKIEEVFEKENSYKRSKSKYQDEESEHPGYDYNQKTNTNDS